MSTPDPDGARRAILEEFSTRSRLLERSRRVDAVALSAIDSLAAAGIESVLLKGAALARTLYRADEARGYFDVDLLVAPSTLAAARQVLTGAGFRSVTERKGVRDIGGSLHAEEWTRLVPGFGPVTLDLHWRLAGCGVEPEDAWVLLSADPGEVELAGGRGVRTLGTVPLAVHVALHMAQHGPGDVKATGDLERALERWPPTVWHEAAELAERLAAGKVFAAGLRLLPAGAALADAMALDRAESELWAIANRHERPRGTFYLSAWRQARTARERAHVLRRALLPSPAWVLWEHPWARRSPLHLAYAYAIHVLRCPVWAARAVQHARRAQRAAD